MVVTILNSWMGNFYMKFSLKKNYQYSLKHFLSIDATLNYVDFNYFKAKFKMAILAKNRLNKFCLIMNFFKHMHSSHYLHSLTLTLFPNKIVARAVFAWNRLKEINMEFGFKHLLSHGTTLITWTCWALILFQGKTFERAVSTRTLPNKTL